MQKNILNQNTLYFIYTTLIVSFVFILPSCSDKKKQSSNKHQNIHSTKNIFKTFIVKSETKTYTLSLQNEILKIDKVSQPIVVINLFKPSCTSCVLHTKSLKNLEKNYNHVFVINIAQNTQDKEKSKFLQNIYATLDISKNALDMVSIIYIDGKYYQHYKGLIPVEMIQHDIQNSNVKVKV